MELVSLKVVSHDGRTLTTRRLPAGMASHMDGLRPAVFLSLPSTFGVFVGIRPPPHSRGQLPHSNPFTHHTLLLLCSSLPSPSLASTLSLVGSMAANRLHSLPPSSLVPTFPFRPLPSPLATHIPRTPLSFPLLCGHAHTPSSSPVAAAALEEGPPTIHLEFLGAEEGAEVATATVGSGDKLLRNIILDNKLELYALYGKVMNCGGGGSCGTCIVEILEGKELLNERTDAEYKYLKQKPESWRLSCQTIVGDKSNSGKVVVQRMPQKKRK